MKSFVLVTLDSCRWDSFQAAQTPFFDALGEAIPGVSHGDSTLPGHKALLHGLLPKTTLWPAKRQFFFPSLPEWFIRRGYSTLAAVSLPYVSPYFGFDRGLQNAKVFCEFEFEPSTDLPPGTIFIKPLIENLSWLKAQLAAYPEPYFIFLNVGETHLPYRHDGMPPWDWEADAPRLTHDFNEGLWTPDDPTIFARMQAAQIEMVEWTDKRFSEFEWPDARWFVTADHGELFGEHGKFGHGIASYPEETNVPVICSDVDWLQERAGVG